MTFICSIDDLRQIVSDATQRFDPAAYYHCEYDGIRGLEGFQEIATWELKELLGIRGFNWGDCLEDYLEEGELEDLLERVR